MIGKKLESFASSKGGRRQIKNVMSPLNWGAGLAEGALMSGVIASDATFVKVACLLIVVAVLIFYGYVYYYFMKNDPDRLQTEAYQIRTQEIALHIDEQNIALPEGSAGKRILFVQSGVSPGSQ